MYRAGVSHRPAQNAHVVTMPARHDHDVRRLAGCELRHCLFEIFRQDLLRLGKALAAGIGLAIINYRNIEAGDSRNLVKACSYVTCAENIKFCWR